MEKQDRSADGILVRMPPSGKANECFPSRAKEYS
jgi:hypothetical protein